jgi:hypothetical protein
MMISVTGYAGNSIKQAMNYQFQGDTALEKASSDSPLTRCDLAILHRLDVCPTIAQGLNRSRGMGAAFI